LRPLSTKNPAIVAERKINITLNGHIPAPSVRNREKEGSINGSKARNQGGLGDLRVDLGFQKRDDASLLSRSHGSFYLLFSVLIFLFFVDLDAPPNQTQYKAHDMEKKEKLCIKLCIKKLKGDYFLVCD
jgi:hypothetical protein